MTKVNLKWILFFLVLPFLFGTDACRDSYNFAAQSTATDSDKPTINFASASSASNGETGTVNINVTLSVASDSDVTIPYTLSGTATLTSDFTISASPLTIAAGSTSTAITVTVVGDKIVEDDETLIITLGTPTGADLGTKFTHTLTISEDTTGSLPEVAFDIEADAWEEGTDLDVVVSLSEALTEDLEVAFTVKGRATLNTDYEIDDSPLVILAGDTEAVITVSALADSEVDDSETVIITLAEDATLYTLGTSNIFRGTIREPGSITTAAARSNSASTTSNLGQEILDGLISLQNQQKKNSIAVSPIARDDQTDCNWIGNKQDPACADNSESFEDADHDGYSDSLENYYGSSATDFQSTPPLAQSKLATRFARVDDDLDGLSNQIENNIGTDAKNADSDGDGIKDGLEDLSGSDPLEVNSQPIDSDLDGLSDQYELSIESNPARIDSDLDGLNDGLEITIGIDPLKFDTDRDGISDFKEVQVGSDPLISDWQIQ